MTVFRSLSCFLVFLAALGLARDARALSYVMMKDVDLLRQADGVATFEVESRLPAAKGGSETRYRLVQGRVLNGDPVSTSEVLALPGILRAADEVVLVPGVPELQAGQRLLVFFERGEDGLLRPMQLTLGLFFEVRDGSDAYYLRNIDLASDAGKGRNAEFHRLRSAHAFELALQDHAATGMLRADYFVADGAIDARQKFNLAQIIFSGGNPPPPGPARWFEFDEGNDVDWYAQANAISPSPTIDEYAALQTALAAWNNEPGSKVVLSYAGVGTAPGSGAIGNVYWNDDRPGGPVVPGTYSCPTGGILAVGGSSATAPARTFQAMSWYVRRNAFVVINDGVACQFDSFGGTGGAQTLGHELGHTLGFSHSCGDQATGACSPGSPSDEALMRAVLHNDARGASLGVDDIAAVRFVYPETGIADLSIASVASPGSVRPGETVTFTHTITNGGPASAASVTVAATAAADLVFVSNSGNCTTAFPCNLGTLANGATRTITTTYRVPSSHPGGGTLGATTSVSSGTPDPTGGNDSALETVDVSARAANLAATIGDSGASVLPGSWIVYQVGVSNAGPSDASSLSLSYVLPADTAFGSASGSGWNCSFASNTVTCTRAALAASANAPLTIVVDVDDPYGGSNPISSSVTISSATTDPTAGNNTGNDTTPVAIPDPNDVFCNGFEPTACPP